MEFQQRCEIFIRTIMQSACYLIQKIRLRPAIPVAVIKSTLIILYKFDRQTASHGGAEGVVFCRKTDGKNRGDRSQ